MNYEIRKRFIVSLKQRVQKTNGKSKHEKFRNYRVAVVTNTDWDYVGSRGGHIAVVGAHSTVSRGMPAKGNTPKIHAKNIHNLLNSPSGGREAVNQLFHLRCERGARIFNERKIGLQRNGVYEGFRRKKRRIDRLNSFSTNFDF